MDPPIHPTTHTHPRVGVSPQIINLQTELNYLDSVNNFQIFSDLTWPHPSTHPPTHQIIHPPMGGEVSTDFKSSNRIEISWLVQVLLNFEWFRGSPLGVGGWVDGVGGGGWVDGGEGGERVHPTYMHMHAHARMHVWHHREFPGIPPMGAAICMRLSCLPRMCVRACMCMHVHVCGGHPPTTPHPHPPTPHPQSRREPETPKYNKSWTNRDNSILFEDSLPLNIPELI